MNRVGDSLRHLREMKEILPKVSIKSQFRDITKISQNSDKVNIKKHEKVIFVKNKQKKEQNNMQYERIKTIRKERNIKQLEVINYLKMHPTTYKRYESGENKPPIELICELCKFYNISADYLLGLIDEPKPLK